MLLLSSLMLIAYLILVAGFFHLSKHKGTYKMEEKLDGKEHTAALNYLHVAEYQALTTRGSYWLVLQFSLVPVVPVYLSLAVGIWSAVTIKEIVIWATLAGLQALALLWAQALLQHYIAIRYMECYLRPLIREGLDTAKFWGYEPHLILHRPTRADWYELILPILGLIIFLTILIFRLSQQFSWWDGAGISLNFILLVILWNVVLKARRVRIEWSRFSKRVSEALDDKRKEIVVLEP
jgi:hypothetical protein